MAGEIRDALARCDSGYLLRKRSTHKAFLLPPANVNGDAIRDSQTLKSARCVWHIPDRDIANSDSSTLRH